MSENQEIISLLNYWSAHTDKFALSSGQTLSNENKELVAKLENLSKRIAEVEKESKGYEKLAKDYKIKLAGCEAEKKELVSKLDENKKCEGEKKVLVEKEIENSKLLNQIDALKRKSEECEKFLESCQEEKKALENDCKKNQEVNKLLKEQALKLQEILESKEKKWEEDKKTFEVQLSEQKRKSEEEKKIFKEKEDEWNEDRKKLKDLETTNQKIIRELEECKDLLEQKKKKLSNYEINLALITREKESLNENLKITTKSRDQWKELYQNNETRYGECDKWKEDLKKLTEEKQRLLQEINACKAENQRMNDLVKTFKKKKANLEEVKEEIKKVQDENELLKKNTQTLINENKLLTNEKQKLETDLKELKRNYDDVEQKRKANSQKFLNQITQITKSKPSEENQIESLQNDLERLKSENKQLQKFKLAKDELEKCLIANTKYKEQLQTLENQLEALKTKEKRFEKSLSDCKKGEELCRNESIKTAENLLQCEKDKRNTENEKRKMGRALEACKGLQSTSAETDIESSSSATELLCSQLQDVKRYWQLMYENCYGLLRIVINFIILKIRYGLSQNQIKEFMDLGDDGKTIIHLKNKFSSFLFSPSDSIDFLNNQSKKAINSFKTRNNNLKYVIELEKKIGENILCFSIIANKIKQKPSNDKTVQRILIAWEKAPFFGFFQSLPGETLQYRNKFLNETLQELRKRGGIGDKCLTDFELQY